MNRQQLLKYWFFILVLLLSSCVFSPQVSRDQHYAENCRMFTKKLTLAVEPISGNGSCAANSHETAAACLMFFGVIVPVGTLVASGSLVVAGNILHWLEYQGACKPAVLEVRINQLISNF